MATSLNGVTKVHAVKFVPNPSRPGKMIAIDDCDCLSVWGGPGKYNGVVQIGAKCSSARLDFLKKNRMRYGHTRKTGGVNEKRRERRKFLRSSLAFSVPKGSTDHASYMSELVGLTTPEYAAQRAARHQYAIG